MDASIYDFVLSELQRAKGSWSEVSRATGISKRTIEKIARREVENPGVLTIEHLARHFRGEGLSPNGISADQ